ncbi:hypothetical protein NVP1081O_304 [Vibrio phage 1.081.O._10N.286.52.C2]|nr:hypothetical protein NVP1081O_304 [Vibrio phage 1.081.O._10N.286.52.C2]
MSAKSIENLEELCMSFLRKAFTYADAETAEHFKTCDVIDYHHTVGQDLRNAYIWESVDVLGNEHADDFSNRMLKKFQGTLHD